MSETQNQAQQLSPKDKIKEEILGKHRVTRVLPRTQMELREQEEILVELAAESITKDIFDKINELSLNFEQKAKLNELKLKYGLK